MLVSVVLFLATVTGDPSAEDIARWVKELGSPHAAMRDHAARRLLEAGDDAADALEAAEFETSEAALMARDLLAILRQPSAVLRPPPFVGRDQKTVLVELLVTNPRPTPLVLEPLYFRMKRGKGLRRNKQWKFEMSKGTSGPHLPRNQLLRRYEIPPRSDLAIQLGFVDRVKGRKSFRVGMSYDGGTFRIAAHSHIRVGRESLSMLRLRAYSTREELRSDAVSYLRHRLRTGKSDPAFEATLRIVARSPYGDMRRGLARAIHDHGPTASRVHTEVLTMLAKDSNLAVSKQAFAAIGRRGKLLNPPSTLRRFASSLFARPGDGRTQYLYAMLSTLTPRARRQFLAGVLSTSRTRAVHKAIAALLRQEGVPVEPGSGGLIPRSQIDRLAR